MIHQCLRDANLDEIKEAGLAGYYTMHDHGVFPADPNGVPFISAYVQCTGDPIADLVEDLAAEQKARATYEHLMTLTCNEEIIAPLRFLREREIVHFQRFGECLEIVQAMQPYCGRMHGHADPRNMAGREMRYMDMTRDDKPYDDMSAYHERRHMYH